MGKREFNVSDVVFTVEKRRNTKRLSVKIIPPNGEVKVTAPKYINDSIIVDFISDNSVKIKDAVDKIQKKYSNTLKRYITGESHYLWGQRYNLLVLEEDVNSVYKIEDRIILKTKSSCISDKEKVLNEFYRKELKTVFPGILDRYSKMMGLEVNQCFVKNMRTRWGTCNVRDKRIWLNLQLAKRPRFCLEYVVVHELTHLIERNHSEKFYSLVERYFPKWREAEDILKMDF